MEEIKKVLEEPLKDLNMWVYDIKYQKKTLNIILDSDEILDIDKIVTATKVISKKLDEYDFIKEKYLLDVSSREKGGN